MSSFIKVAFVVLALVLGTTGAVSAGAATTPASDADLLAVMRDENEFALVGDDDDGDDDDDDSRDISRSRDRSRDVTTPDRSRSLDRSRDRTGDRVNALDRSRSLDRSRDRTGDHNTPDISRSNDVSADVNTTAGDTDTDTDD